MDTDIRYNFLKTVFKRNKNDGERTLSMTSALKPLTIGSITNIAKQNNVYLRNKIVNQIKRLNVYQNKLNTQINDPKYLKVQQKNKIDLMFLKKAINIHRVYFNKILYYKNKTMNPNVILLQNYFKQYSNQLFMLNQQYQKAKLELKGVDTNENQTGNNNQFSEVRM